MRNIVAEKFHILYLGKFRNFLNCSFRLTNKRCETNDCFVLSSDRNDHRHQSALDHSNAITTCQFILLEKGSKEVPDHEAKLCIDGARGRQMQRSSKRCSTVRVNPPLPSDA